MERYSTSQVAVLSGATYRQLDYWASNGVLTPTVADATGQGSRRSYSEADVERARVLAAVSALGATSPVLTRLRDVLDSEDCRVWPLLLFVQLDGTVSDQIVPGAACYVVDVGGLCAAGYNRHRLRVPAA